jgi:hypothetical protein
LRQAGVLEAHFTFGEITPIKIPGCARSQLPRQKIDFPERTQ